MAEMVERCSQAIRPIIEKALATGCCDREEVVRSVMEAMTQPTEAMLSCLGERAAWTEEARQNWMAMMDEARK